MITRTPQHFIVIGPNVYGKGTTPEEARKKAVMQLGESFRPMKNYIVFLVAESTTVTGMGDLSFDMEGQQPIELYRVIDDKQVPAGTERVKG